jgi:plastocyanin
LRAAADILAPVLAASEPSKVPFYFAGSVLAAWAVVLAFIGITQPDFPGTGGRARAVMGISALLVLCTVGTAVATSSKHDEEGEEAKAGEPAAKEAPAGQAPPPAGGGGGSTVRISADPSGQLAFQQKSVNAKPGKVTIDFDNPSPVAHDVTVIQGSKKLGATKVITDSKATVDVTLQPGSYTYYCSVDAHRQAGMEGKLTTG